MIPLFPIPRKGSTGCEMYTEIRPTLSSITPVRYQIGFMQARLTTYVGWGWGGKCLVVAGGLEPKQEMVLALEVRVLPPVTWSCCLWIRAVCFACCEWTITNVISGNQNMIECVQATASMDLDKVAKRLCESLFAAEHALALLRWNGRCEIPGFSISFTFFLSFTNNVVSSLQALVVDSGHRFLPSRFARCPGVSQCDQLAREQHLGYSIYHCFSHHCFCHIVHRRPQWHLAHTHRHCGSCRPQCYSDRDVYHLSERYLIGYAYSGS